MIRDKLLLLSILVISCTYAYQRSHDHNIQSDQADIDHVVNGHRIADEAFGIFPEEYRSDRQPSQRRRRPPKRNENEINADVSFYD